MGWNGMGWDGMGWHWMVLYSNVLTRCTLSCSANAWIQMDDITDYCLGKIFFFFPSQHLSL